MRESGRPEWWKGTSVYQIYPRSFSDANGDGLGDIKGIVARLDYLVELGVETLWFSPFYASPQADFGYDISDYRAIAPEYGTMEDCELLIEECHRRDLRVVFDMVMNHTSDQHPWFLESRSSKVNPRRDWYVWKEGRKAGGKAPPNNWHSMIGGSGWHYDATTDQWYWAQFLPFQPDLNYRNPEVRKEMLDTLRFWLKKGVDGFRLDIVNALFEDPEFRNNAFSWRLAPSDADPSMLFQSRDATLNHPDTLSFMKVLRQTLEEFHSPDRFLVGEVNGPIEQVRAHCGERADGLHLGFLFRSLSAKLQAPSIRALILEYETKFPDPFWPTWVFSNHDRARRISRLGNRLPPAKLNAAWQLTARGVPFLYYGEEIGMTQRKMAVKSSLDAVAQRMKRIPQWVFELVRHTTGESINRDECRTPMQWDITPNAGFCRADVTPWLPVEEALTGRNVQEQTTDPDSLLACYRRFLGVRKESLPLRFGTLELLSQQATGPNVVGYVRNYRGESVTVFLNAGDRSVPAPESAGEGTVLVSTHASRPTGTRLSADLQPWEAVVLATPRPGDN